MFGYWTTQTQRLAEEELKPLLGSAPEDVNRTEVTPRKWLFPQIKQALSLPGSGVGLFSGHARQRHIMATKVAPPDESGSLRPIAGLPANLER